MAIFSRRGPSFDQAPRDGAAGGGESGGRESGGVLLVGHGTRDPLGQSEFLATARQVGDRLARLPVEPCFLELAAPSIGEGVQRLIDRGARRLVVSPTLLFAAGHANHDIPAAVTIACRDCERRDGVEIVWDQAAHLGCHEAILQLSRHRESEAFAARSLTLEGPLALEASPLAKRKLAARGRSMRLLVGRGSRDALATQEMWEFVAQRRARSDRSPTSGGEPLDDGNRTSDEGGTSEWGPLDACFLAMAEPLLPAALQRIAAQQFARVLVQPHLLFAGLLTAEIEQCVARMAERHREIEWIVAQRLGPDRLVVDALCDRIAATSVARGWGLTLPPTDREPSTPPLSATSKSGDRDASVVPIGTYREGMLGSG